MNDGPRTSVCVAGAMELSRAVDEALRSIADGRPAAAPASSAFRQSRWYCPADGARMDEKDGQVICPSCGRHLPGQVRYQLIEFHVHPGQRKGRP
jgi:hypothetical protein